MKKLVLVWNKGDRQQVIVPLKDVTQEVYNKLTSMFGVPKGRTEVM
jgi:hypothetical protein